MPTGMNSERGRPRGGVRPIAIMLFALAATCAGVATANAGPYFAPPFMAFRTTAMIRGAAVGDLNGDGRPDLVTANDTANVVAVLLGSGDGRFGDPSILATGSRTWAVAIGDLNADGAQDLVVGTSAGFGVMLGNGDGTFAPMAARALPTEVTSIALHDLNGDARPDVVGSCSFRTDVWACPGNGDGTFGPTSTRVNVFGPNGFAVGDLNGDGKPDLVVAASDCAGELYRAYGNGDCSFGPLVLFATLLCNPYAPTLGDLDGDGMADLVVCELGYSRVDVFMGRGDGSFAPPSHFGTGGPSFALVERDFDRDGRPDIVAVSVGGIVSTLLGNGAGAFAPKQDCAAGGQRYVIATGDFDLDGWPDLTVAGASSAWITILLNTQGGPPLGVPAAHSDGTLHLRLIPNPSGASFRAAFVLPERARVCARVFDTAGRAVASNDLGVLEAGAHEARLSSDGTTLRPGVYLVEVSTGGTVETTRLSIVR